MRENGGEELGESGMDGKRVDWEEDVEGREEGDEVTEGGEGGRREARDGEVEEGWGF